MKRVRTRVRTRVKRMIRTLVMTRIRTRGKLMIRTLVEWSRNNVIYPIVIFDIVNTYKEKLVHNRTK